MPLDSSPSHTPKPLGKDLHPPPSESAATPATQSHFFQRVRVHSSTGSVAGAENGEEDERSYITDIYASGEASRDACGADFPALPPASSDGVIITVPQVISPPLSQPLRGGSFSTPPSAAVGSFSTTSFNEFRSSPQKAPLQSPPSQHQQQQQHRLSKSSLASTPPRSTETAHLIRQSPFTAITTGVQNTPRGSGLGTTRRAPSPLSPRTTPARASSPKRRNSPATVVSPPPFSFSFHTSTPTRQRTSPSPQALTSPAPQLALQRTTSRTRPFIGGGTAVVTPTGSPRSHTLQPAAADPALPLTTCTPHRTPAALPHSLSGRQTPISPYPALHSVLSSQESLRAPEAAHFYPTADAGDSTAVVSAADNTTPTAAADVEEDPDDLLVERIIRNPHKMGQGHGSCEKTHPPREASHSRSSPEENASRSRHIDHTPRRIHSPSCGLDVRTGRYRQGRRQSLSPSSFSSSPTDKQERNKSAALAIAAATDPLSGTEVDDADWVFQRPPNNQRTFYFKEDNLEFSSQFDSGNLIQVERVGPFQYRMYTAMDCGNAPWQTNNRQWFHFSLRGGGKGVVVTFTFVGMMHSSMFNFDWMPVTAVTPSRPEYARLVGKAKVEPLENMPETPGYPLLVHKEVSKDDADSDGDNNDDDNDADNGAANICSNNNANTNNSTNAGGGVAFSISATNGKAGAGGKKSKNKKKKKFLAMNLTFEYKVEAEVPVTHTPPKGRPDVVAIYIASNHPYSYSRLQRNLLAWQEVARKSNATRSQSVQAANKALASSSSHGQRADAAEARAAHTPSNTHLGDNTGDTGGLSVASKATMEVAFSSVYYHREVLCKTLEGHDVTLLTISDRSRMTMERAPLISEKDGIPYSSAKRTTERPFVFSGKKYVVLTARVHPGECPGSHLMHGCIEFLLNCSDPRAAALRHNFVFYIVPMLNPDGVVRGHSRVDANGVDLNRMYRAPSRKRHPAPYSVMALLKSLNGRVALFVDMHAHANKRGTFFYGNSMGGVEQVENLLYAKLVSVNTPYLDFRSCNFSEANMFAVGKSGKGKDSSSRVVVYTEAGIVHGYTVETSHVMADALNPVVTLVDAQGEHVEKVLQTPLQLAHTPATFGDTGRAMLVALLDLKNVNPVSRLPFTPYHSTRGVSMWLQRQLQIETAELLFAQAFKAHGKEVQAASHETGNNLLGPILRSLTADEFPDKITIKKARLLPRTTYSGVRSFLPMETAVALLSQTSPTGPPRSFLYASAGSSSAGGGGGGHARRRGASPATGMNTSNAVTAAVTTPVTDFPAVIATKRRSRPNAPGADMMLES